MKSVIGKKSYLALVMIATLVLPWAAFADDVRKAVVNGGTDTVVVNGSTAYDYWISQQLANQDGEQGCNADPSTPAIVTIVVPDEATANPSQLTFTACGGNDKHTVAFTSAAPGDYSITASLSDGGTGRYDVTDAAFTLHVHAPPPPPNTVPSVSVTGVTDGASYDKGQVPAAMCEVTDAEDGPSSFAATLSAVNGTYASDGIGVQTESRLVTDAGGLAASASATYSIVDPSAPVISYTLNPASPDGSNGWYKGNVTLAWAVTENESPSSLVMDGCEDQDIIADRAETAASSSARSSAGSSPTPWSAR